MKKKSGFKKCDEEYFKPTFIYNYENRKSEILFMKTLMKMNSDKFDILDPIQKRFLLNAKLELDKLSPKEVDDLFEQGKKIADLKMSMLDEDRGHN